MVATYQPALLAGTSSNHLRRAPRVVEWKRKCASRWDTVSVQNFGAAILVGPHGRFELVSAVPGC